MWVVAVHGFTDIGDGPTWLRNQLKMRFDGTPVVLFEWSADVLKKEMSYDTIGYIEGVGNSTIEPAEVLWEPVLSEAIWDPVVLSGRTYINGIDAHECTGSMSVDRVWGWPTLFVPCSLPGFAIISGINDARDPPTARSCAMLLKLCVAILLKPRSVRARSAKGDRHTRVPRVCLARSAACVKTPRFHIVPHRDACYSFPHRFVMWCLLAEPMLRQFVVPWMTRTPLLFPYFGHK